VHTQAGAAGAPSGGYPIRSIRTETHKFIMNLNHEVKYGNNVTENNEGEFWVTWVAAAGSNNIIKNLVDNFLYRSAEEFYDIVADPTERNNLIEDAQYKPLVDSLRARLLNWMESQGDKGMETEALAGTRK